MLRHRVTQLPITSVSNPDFFVDELKRLAREDVFGAALAERRRLNREGDGKNRGRFQTCSGQWIAFSKCIQMRVRMNVVNINIDSM